MKPIQFDHGVAQFAPRYSHNSDVYDFAQFACRLLVFSIGYDYVTNNNSVRPTRLRLTGVSDKCTSRAVQL